MGTTSWKKVFYGVLAYSVLHTLLIAHRTTSYLKNKAQKRMATQEASFVQQRLDFKAYRKFNRAKNKKNAKR